MVGNAYIWEREGQKYEVDYGGVERCAVSGSTSQRTTLIEGILPLIYSLVNGYKRVVACRYIYFFLY
jgi:hypothetical protein